MRAFCCMLSAGSEAVRAPCLPLWQFKWSLFLCGSSLVQHAGFLGQDTARALPLPDLRQTVPCLTQVLWPCLRVRLHAAILLPQQAGVWRLH